MKRKKPNEKPDSRVNKNVRKKGLSGNKSLRKTTKEKTTKKKTKLEREYEAFNEFIEDLEDEGLTLKQIQKEIKKYSIPNIKIPRFNNFYITFTAIRSYTYNRPTELETFTRDIPVHPAISLDGFRKKYLQWIVEYEMKIFDKISEDQSNNVTWSNWVYEVKIGEED